MPHKIGSFFLLSCGDIFRVKGTWKVLNIRRERYINEYVNNYPIWNLSFVFSPMKRQGTEGEGRVKSFSTLNASSWLPFSNVYISSPQKNVHYYSNVPLSKGSSPDKTCLGLVKYYSPLPFCGRIRKTSGSDLTASTTGLN